MAFHVLYFKFVSLGPILPFGKTGDDGARWIVRQGWRLYMIFRLSQKLKTKINAGPLATLPLDENPFADWSAGLFFVGRSQYVLLSNTNSLYSTVLPGKGITTETSFIERALINIREFMEVDGLEGVYERFVLPVSGSIQFAKALSRSVTGSMNDMTKHAAYWLADGEMSLIEIGNRLNEIPMSALKHSGSSYGFPRKVFNAVVATSEGKY